MAFSIMIIYLYKAIRIIRIKLELKYLGAIFESKFIIKYLKKIKTRTKIILRTKTE